MSNYADEHTKYWPMPSELMVQYKDGTHTEKPKTITARDAYAIYEEAIEKRNLMLAKLWEETYAPKLDKLIRERAELGCNFVYLEYDTWGPMKNFIEGLGYEVREYADTLSVSWSKG